MCFTVEFWFPGYGRRDCLPFAMSEWTARQLPLPCRWAVNETYLAIQCTFQAVSLPFPARECQRKLSDGWKLSHPADGRSVWQSCSRQLFAGDTELAAPESKRIGKKLHPAIHRLYRLLLCHLGRRFFALLLSSSLDSSATNSSRCLDWAPLEASKKAETAAKLKNWKFLKCQQRNACDDSQACSCCSVFRVVPSSWSCVGVATLCRHYRQSPTRCCRNHRSRKRISSAASTRLSKLSAIVVPSGCS